MKKTINIHLGRQLFIIEEDAYARLNAYLEKLKSSFASEEGAEEIVEDIEMRCAELIQNLLTEQKITVVQLSHVNEVIQSLGEPEEISDNTTTTEQTKSTTEEEHRDTRRRLFRDMDNATIGGVCAGVAAYLNLDLAIIRILFVISFFMGFGFLLYIILWVAVPNAKTPSDRLQLKGKAVTIDSIKDEISRTATAKKKEFMQSAEKWRNNDHISDRLRQIVKIIGVLCGVGFLFFSSLWLIGFILTITGVLDVFPVTIEHKYATLHQYLSLVCANDPDTLSLFWNSIIISGFAFPILGIVLGVRILINRKVKALKYAIIVLPFICATGMIMMMIGGFRMSRDFTNEPEIEIGHKNIAVDSLNLLELQSNKQYKNGGSGFFNFERVEKGKIFESGINIKTLVSKDTMFHVYEVLSAHGIDDETATKRANRIKHEWKIQGNIIYVSPYYHYPVRDGLKNQEVQLVIEIPVGKNFAINGTPLLELNKERNGIYYGNKDYEIWDEDDE